MAKRRSTNSNSVPKVPKVHIARPAGRPFQLRYHCPLQKKQVRISISTRDETIAQERKQELEAKLLLGIDPQPVKKIVYDESMPWEDFREQFRTLHLATLRNGSAEDAEVRLDVAQKILKPKTLGDIADVNALHTLQARLLVGEASIRNRPRSPHTVRGYMNSVLAAMNWAHLQGWLNKAPKLRKIKVGKLKVMKGRPITEKEFKQMLKATKKIVGDDAAASWKYLLSGLWESALRLDELMHVSWNLPNTIRPIWREGELPILDIPAGMQKNATEECIPLLPGFESLLLETPEEERTGWIFNPQSLQAKLGRNPKQQRPSTKWVGKIISRIGKEAKVLVKEEDTTTGRPEKFASAHDLRRSCGQRLRDAGVPPLVICRVMRHSSWETTQKHYAPGDIQNDAKVLRTSLVSKKRSNEDD